MSTKKRPSRIIYKYVEVPRQPATTPVEESTPKLPEESLAYRAWVNCYQPPSGHSAHSTSSASSSRSRSTSGLHSTRSSTPSHGCATNPSLKRSSLPTTNTSAPPAQKSRSHSSPVLLTNFSTIPPAPLACSPKHTSPPTSPPSRPLKTSCTTTLSTYKRKDGAVITECRVVSSQGFQDGKSTADWPVFRSPDWAYPLRRRVKGKKVHASYPHCQQW